MSIFPLVDFPRGVPTSAPKDVDGRFSTMLPDWNLRFGCLFPFFLLAIRSSDEVKQEPADGVGHVSCEEGKPLLSIIGEVRLAEAVAGVRYCVRKCGNGVHDLHWEGTSRLELFRDVVLYHLAQWHQVG